MGRGGGGVIVFRILFLTFGPTLELLKLPFWFQCHSRSQLDIIRSFCGRLLSIDVFRNSNEESHAYFAELLISYGMQIQHATMRYSLITSIPAQNILISCPNLKFDFDWSEQFKICIIRDLGARLRHLTLSLVDNVTPDDVLKVSRACIRVESETIWARCRPAVTRALVQGLQLAKSPILNRFHIEENLGGAISEILSLC